MQRPPPGLTSYGLYIHRPGLHYTGVIYVMWSLSAGGLYMQVFTVLFPLYCLSDTYFRDANKVVQGARYRSDWELLKNKDYLSIQVLIGVRILISNAYQYAIHVQCNCLCSSDSLRIFK